MPALPQDQARALIARRHPEWVDFERRWRWLADALEGGNAYRYGKYGQDPTRPGYAVGNLVRHRRETPPVRRGYEPDTTVPYGRHVPGTDPYAVAPDDPYEQRRARTPVPRFTAQTIEAYLSLIYEREIKRSAPFADLEGWWLDCDGRGTTIDDWIRDEVAPLALVLGQIDLCFDHPAPPPGAIVASEADVNRLGLRKCVAGYILPEHVLWWRLRPDGGYAELVVKEHWDMPVPVVSLDRAQPAERREDCYYRHWTAEDSVLYDERGDVVRLGDDGMPLPEGTPGGTPQVIPHRYGRPPIFRWFFRRKPRRRNVGQSPFEGIAEKEREFYNQDSETILANSLQAHATLMIPEAMTSANGDLTVGPDWTLPIVQAPDGTVVKPEYLSPPKEAASFLEQTKASLIDLIDREAARTKPAGSAAAGGNGGSTVSQSGVSKAMDQRDGNAVLCKVGKALQRLEYQAVRFVRLVVTDGQGDPGLDLVKVQYPPGYNLQSADELLALGALLQQYLDAAGDIPEFDKAFTKAAIREALPGLDDDLYAKIDGQVDDLIERKAKAKEEAAEMAPAIPATFTTDRPPGPQPALPGRADGEAGDAEAA